ILRASHSGAAPPPRPRRSPGILAVVAIAGTAVGLLLTACSSSPSPAGIQAHRAIAAPAATGPLANTHADYNAIKGAASARFGVSSPVQPRLIRLVPPPQTLIYTASLTLRVKNVTATAAAMTNLVTGVGGYVAGQRETIPPGGHGTVRVSLTLKIPAAA